MRLIAVALGNVLGRVMPHVALRGAWVLAAAVIVISAYSAFALGSNDVSNAASSLVIAHPVSARLAGLYGGVFMAIGVLTWGGGWSNGSVRASSTLTYRWPPVPNSHRRSPCLL
ncbi:MAG: hypothetical protein ACR2KG_02085 [Nocardioidaceae bacterium]